jgi:hypothetical protein
MEKGQGESVAAGTRRGSPSFTWLKVSRWQCLKILYICPLRTFRPDNVIVPAVIPDTTRVLTEENLMARFPGLSNRQFGDRWFDSRDSAVLEVRSAVVPFEHNYLLNPQHPEFSQILVGPAVPFSFDERLFGSR